MKLMNRSKKARGHVVEGWSAVSRFTRFVCEVACIEDVSQMDLYGDVPISKDLLCVSVSCHSAITCNHRSDNESLSMLKRHPTLQFNLSDHCATGEQVIASAVVELLGENCNVQELTFCLQICILQCLS